MSSQGKESQGQETVAVTCATHSNQLVANLYALDIFEGNTTSLGMFTVVRHYSTRCIMQYPGNHCQKLEVYTNFRVAQEFKVLKCFKA